MSQSAAPTPPVRVLLDTNILLRLSDTRSRQHAVALNAVRVLTTQGAALCITPQNLIEFWSVATRSKSENGLGLPSVAAHAELAKHRAAFLFLPDRADIFAAWETLVRAHSIRGADVHDTRLAAVALAYKVPNILTFNIKHFAHFASSGLTALDPATVGATKTSSP